ncbi:MAG: hypothetical protein WC794_05455 [Candidatus Doudnabacteria bacterium]
MIQNTTLLSNVKLKITGNVVQYFKFKRPFPLGQRPNEKKRPRSKNTRLRKYNLFLAKRRIIDYVNSNAGAYKDITDKLFLSVFLTLTFAKNVTDIDEANLEFHDFIGRLNVEVTGEKKRKLKYVAVIEFQKRGAVHYHVIFFNLPFLEKDKIFKIWGNGYIDIHKIAQVKNIGFYITKYMTKKMDDDRLKNRSCYLVSKGLLKPKIVYSPVLADMLIREFPKSSVSYEKYDAQVPYLESMDMVSFNLKDRPDLIEKMHKTIDKLL